MYFTRAILKRTAAAALLAVTACHGGTSSSSFVPAVPGVEQSPEAKAAIRLSHKSLSFDGTGATLKQTVVATELKYEGEFTQKNTCAKVASIAPRRAKGPKAKFAVTPIGAGSCSMTVTDSKKHKASASITVSIPPPVDPTLSPAVLSFNQTGATAALPFSATQTGYSGTFKESDTCGGIATVAATSWAGPSAAATVTPVGAGTCTITIANSAGGSSGVSVTVTTSGIVIQ